MEPAGINTLLTLIDASPSPFHVVETASGLLSAAGFVERNEAAAWNGDAAGRWFVRRGGALVAWVQGDSRVGDGFRLIGAHTDSPNLRIKPQPDRTAVGYRQLGVEVYGGVLLNSWLDRDLGVSGVVSVRDHNAIDRYRDVLFRSDAPILRIPQLAIHLDREIHDRGLQLNKQTHMSPVWGTGAQEPGAFARFVADLASVDVADVLSWSAMTHDLTPSRVVGMDQSMIAAPRIDNQMSCWAGLAALLDVADQPADATSVLCLFDHEEVGSVSRTGAASSMLPTLLARIVRSSGGSEEDHAALLSRSWCVSADGAHATHPNYADRHEANHQIQLNGGPVVKINANERYATTSESHALFVAACERADVPFQRFVNRTDLSCGSTIGPVTSARLGIRTVDAGVAQLAMHSARETAGADDYPRFVAVLSEVLRS